MAIAFGIIFTIIFYLLSYPLAKNFQLCGYDLKYYLSHSYMLPYEFKGKNRLIFTKRLIRLITLYFVVLAALTLTYFLLIKEVWLISLLCVIELFALNYILSLCAFVLIPVERLIKKHYINSACKILQNFKGVKIAITGSYGKTSTKNFLSHMLKQKYNVCATPRNFNTPMGLCKTAREHLLPSDEVLVVEMGAKHKGDIAELMDMLKPNFGIITAIGEQHLETFGSLQNILSTKFELCEKIGKNGEVVFDGNNEYSVELYKRFSGKKHLAGVQNSAVKVLDFSFTPNGTTLNMEIGGRKRKVQTQIIGRMLINDIVLAATMALLVGVSEDDVVKAISTLKPAPHRLQLIHNKDSTIIDDAYNSNLAGAAQACECLKLYSGTKIIVSPGLVEQGDKQYELNFKLGKIFGESCDILIIMNEVNKLALSKGAIAAGFKEENLRFAQTRKQQIEILKSLQPGKRVILFENDLPDNYK